MPGVPYERKGIVTRQNLVCSEPPDFKNINKWGKKAACHNLDVEFFPAEDDIKLIRKAQDICLTCPVRPECLHWAMWSAVDAGIWGGATAEQRRKLRRQKGKL